MFASRRPDGPAFASLDTLGYAIPPTLLPGPSEEAPASPDSRRTTESPSQNLKCSSVCHLFPPKVSENMRNLISKLRFLLFLTSDLADLHLELAWPSAGLRCLQTTPVKAADSFFLCGWPVICHADVISGGAFMPRGSCQRVCSMSTWRTRLC